jgi:tetratricopeptide (TPR) repeat protein
MTREQDRQRKFQRKAKKASKRRERKRQNVKSPLSLDVAWSLNEAEELLAKGEYHQAIDVLEELRRRYPGQPEVFSCLAEAYLRTGDRWSYQATCARLAAADPTEPMSWLALGSAAITNAQLAAAHRAFTHAAVNWPNHPETPMALEVLESLDGFLAEECRSRGLDEAAGFGILLLHDEINLHLQRGKFDKVCDAATRLLAICPTFAPALNNRSEAHFRSARYAEAIADSRRVLEFDATNYHALANLTRYLFLSGRFDEAYATADSLKACVSHDSDAFVKKAETFAILGDWEAVLRAVHAGESVWAECGGTPGLAEHLAGVALANLGDLAAARKHWRRAADAPDAVDWADENRKDSQRPLGKRHGPWAFPLEHWIPRGVVEELVESVTRSPRRGTVTDIVKRHFERHPQLELLAETLVEQGDPSACEMLIRLAPLVERPAIFAALKKFALGRRGIDDLRMQALMTLSQAGFVEGQVDMWRNGALHPVGLMSQELYCEPTGDVPPEVNDLMLSAWDAIHDGRGAAAEQLLDDGLRLRPDDVSMQFNRAVAIGLQGRRDEALAIVRQIHRDCPDYVFARTHLADECIANGNVAEAKTLLAPVTKQQRLHVSEYAAWCSANINLALAEGNRDAARSLLKSWEQVDPDDQRIKIWKGRVKGVRGLRSRLSRLIGQSQRGPREE